MEIFPFDYLPGIIRKIAKKDYWQTVYTMAKDYVGGTKLLVNDRDYTHYQMMFLGNLAFYSSLYYDIAMGEVSDRVMQNEIYEDAYYHYRNEKRLAKTKRADMFSDIQHGTVVKKLSDSKEEIVNKNLWTFTKIKRT